MAISRRKFAIEMALIFRYSFPSLMDTDLVSGNELWLPIYLVYMLDPIMESQNLWYWIIWLGFTVICFPFLYEKCFTGFHFIFPLALGSVFFKWWNFYNGKFINNLHISYENDHLQSFNVLKGNWRKKWMIKWGLRFYFVIS